MGALDGADTAVDLFAALGPVRVRRMFGGAGLFLDGVMFGLIAGGAIHLKAAAALGEGSSPFTFDKAGRPVRLGYWSLPDAALDDPDLACDLAAAALTLARAARRD